MKKNDFARFGAEQSAIERTGRSLAFQRAEERFMQERLSLRKSFLMHDKGQISGKRHEPNDSARPCYNTLGTHISESASKHGN